jgi:hypothetical protein
MTSSKGFWSYVHDDDRTEGGRIVRLARDIVDQYQMLTGENINLLFLDKDNITWGDEWRKELDSSLASVAFFIPVITPRYFMSPECRRELQYFVGRTSESGLNDLILPLHYVNVPALTDDTTKDELIERVKTFQWVDWRDLRFSDVSSEKYRRSVAKLAEKLVEANKHAEETTAPVSTQIEEKFDDNKDDSPGLIDTLASSEEKLNKLPETLDIITQYISQIGQIMNEEADNIQRSTAQGKGFSSRLMVVRQTANRLSELTEHIWSLSNLYASQLHSIDSGFRIIIGQATLEIKERPENKPSFCTFFEAVCKMSVASNIAIESTRLMLAAAEPLEKISRDLRPVLRRLKQGLTILIESSGVIAEWVHLIDATGIKCEDSIA